MSVSSRIRYTIEAVNKTRDEFAQVEQDLERLTKARLAASKVVLEEQRAQRYLSQAYMAQHQQFMDTISVMRNVGAIGRGLLQMWQAYTISQMHVTDSLDKVDEAQRRVNTALELYGENSVVYLDAVYDLEKLQEAADKAKGDETMGLLGLGMTAVGVAAEVGTLAAKLGLIEELALAGGILIPIVVTIAVAKKAAEVREELKEEFEDTPYWWSEDEPYKPGKIGIPSRGGFDLQKWIWDMIAGADPSMGGGRGFGGGGVNITQINYGVEGAQDSVDSLSDLLDRLFSDEG